MDIFIIYTPYKFTGKEYDEMHGLNQYDYHARQYDPVIPSFDSVDPLAEKYYSWSPYVYCMNNSLKYIDPDGMDAMRTGSGTEKDPYVITANYYYQNGELTEKQIKGLNSAIAAYNNNGKVVEVEDEGGMKIYVSFNLNVSGVDNVAKAITNDIFTNIEGQDVSYGNRIGLESNGGDEYGSANGWRVDLSPNNIIEAVSGGMNEFSLLKGVYIHEIGHNLSLQDHDKTSIMSKVTTRPSKALNGTITNSYTYPKVDKKGIELIINRVNKPRVDGMGIIRTKKSL